MMQVCSLPPSDQYKDSKDLQCALDVWCEPKRQCSGKQGLERIFSYYSYKLSRKRVRCKVWCLLQSGCEGAEGFLLGSGRRRA